MPSIPQEFETNDWLSAYGLAKVVKSMIALFPLVHEVLQLIHNETAVIITIIC